MQSAVERFLEVSRRHLMDTSEPEAGRATEPGTTQSEISEMKTLDTRLKDILARRMKDAVVNPPHRVFARELLSRGLTANEVWQLVMHDETFVRVPESFRIAVANAAREMASQQLVAATRSTRRTDRDATA
jgi:hypothetical protein